MVTDRIIGDSHAHLGPQPPKPLYATKEVKIVQGWLKKEFGKEFTYEGNKLKHAKQDDSISCGLHLPSAIEHDLFNVELCTDKTARLHRMQWFVRLGRAQTNYICL
jgi:hypothetical protein